uniref:Uncharacterized protein n=1 Tax=Onchocerca volvulus TaxID=6282 RepID=A0A8R1XW16_ONCVO
MTFGRQTFPTGSSVSSLQQQCCVTYDHGNVQSQSPNTWTGKGISCLEKQFGSVELITPVND